MFHNSLAAGGGLLRRLIAASALFGLSAAGALAAEVEAFPDAKRVVAVGGSLLEVVYALGEESRLVARDSTGLYPPEAMSLPDVGYMRALSPEGVLSVNPDAILMLEGSGPPEAVDVLRKASVPVVTVPDNFTREGILDKIRIVGHALGVEDKASALAATVDADITAASMTAAHDVKKRVLFVLSMQGGRILASGSDTAADGILKLAGAVNAVEGFAGYKQLTDEAVHAAAPDVVLMMDRGGDHSATADELFAHPALAGTPAGTARALFRVDGVLMLGFGPRTAEAIGELAGALYGAD